MGDGVGFPIYIRGGRIQNSKTIKCPHTLKKKEYVVSQI